MSAAYEEKDDLVHVPGPEPDWREAYYFEFCDPASGRMGFANFGKLPNKRRGGSLVQVWDPEQGLLVAQEPTRFERHTDEHRIGGLRVECVEPMREWRIAFDGDLVQVPLMGQRRYHEAREIEPEQRVNVPARFEFRWRAFTELHAFDVSDPAWEVLYKGGGHHEQVGSAHGSLSAGSAEWSLDGWTGVRDHSWGARDWVGLESWRWVACVFEQAPYLSMLEVRVPGGGRGLEGAVYRGDGRAVAVKDYEVVERFEPAAGKDEPVWARFEVEDVEGEVLEFTAEVKAMLPTRFRDKRSPGKLNWNDRTVAALQAPHGAGIGTVEFASSVRIDP